MEIYGEEVPEDEEYFYESVEDDDLILLDDDEVPQRTRTMPHEELTDEIIDAMTRSSSVNNGFSSEDISTLEEKYGEKAKKAARYLLPIFKEAKELGIETPAEFKKYADAAGPVSSIIRDKRLLKLEGCEDIYDAIFKNEYLSIDDCVKDIEKLLAAASQDKVKKNAMTVIWTHASQVLNTINDEMLDDGIDDGAKNQQKLFSRIVTPERIERMSQAWDIPKEEISNCNSILELLEVLYSKENLAKIYNSSNVDERPRTKGEVRKANKALELKHSGRRVRNAEDNKRVYDKEMVKAVDDAKIANYTAKYDALKAEQEKLGKERLELRRQLDSLNDLDPRYEEKYDDITAQIKDLNSQINRASKSASSVLYTLNRLKGGVSHTKKQAAADKSVERHSTLSGDFESLANNFLDDFNIGNNDMEAKRRVLNQIRDTVGVKERKPDMAGLVKALEGSSANYTISFFIRSDDPEEAVPMKVRRYFVDKFIETFTNELKIRPEDYGTLFAIDDIPISKIYEYNKDPKKSDFYEDKKDNAPGKLNISYRNGIEIKVTYPKRGEFHKFLRSIKLSPKGFNIWLRDITKKIIESGNDIHVAWSKTIVEI